MIKYAIVGNIASGKSTVEKLLQDKGYIVADSDIFAHDLLNNNQDVVNAFKDYDIFENNKISRKKLGTIVFKNPELRKKLENIIHPQVKLEIEKFFIKHQNEKCVFVSVPLLFECNMENMFDKIIFIYTDDNIRLERLMKRNNFTAQEAKLRMDSQTNQDEKAHKSDIIIYNNSTVDELAKQLFTSF